MKIDNKKLSLFEDNSMISILFFSLYSAWQLSFVFQGQVLFILFEKYSVSLSNITLFSIAALFIGLILSGYLVDKLEKSRATLIWITVFSIAGTLIFYLPYSFLWDISLIILSFISGIYIAAWGFYYKTYSTSNNRVKTIAKALIFSNLIMVIINIIAINLSPYIGLTLAILCLVTSLLVIKKSSSPKEKTNNEAITNIVDISKPVLLLYIFIAIITVTSGLMYQVINPAYSHHRAFASWYWAVPYLVALYILMKSSKKVNKAYILYLAIAMIGLSFVFFLILDRSVLSYIIVNTLMMGAFGVCDLFWWSIIGELLDYVKNPAKLLGLGLSANVLGILIGSAIGAKINIMSNTLNSASFALLIVFLILIILPLLNKHLSIIINEHIFLFRIYNYEKEIIDDRISIRKKYPNLTDRENEIVELLLSGRTYKMIAEELFLSENTIKTHIKNIYSKYNIQSKAELIKALQEILVTQKR